MGGFCPRCAEYVQTLKVEALIAAASDQAHQEEPDFMDEDEDEDDDYPPLDPPGGDSGSSAPSGGGDLRTGSVALGGDIDFTPKRQRLLDIVVEDKPS